MGSVSPDLCHTRIVVVKSVSIPRNNIPGK